MFGVDLAFSDHRVAIFQSKQIACGRPAFGKQGCIIYIQKLMVKGSSEPFKQTTSYSAH